MSKNQLDLHKKIDKFFEAGTESATVEIARGLIGKNNDAKNYFFYKANENWLDWFWQNKFFDKLKEKAKNTDSYSYTMPELGYLEKMAVINPKKVVEIIDFIRISEKNLNPEVIDRFLWVMGGVPSEYSKLLTKKVRDENWFYLMRKFYKSGYNYSKIISNLIKGKENESILELSQAIFALKSKIEIKKDKYIIEEPFCVSDLDASGIFNALVDIDNDYVGGALEVTIATYKEIIELGEPDENEIFQYADLYSLFDVDFFTLSLKNENSFSYRKDVKNLAATIKELAVRYIRINACNEIRIKEIIDLINGIPTCRSVWRLRLFIISQFPELFKKELEDSFFKIFDVGERYYDIGGDAEYYKALKNGFAIISKSEQRRYIKNVLKYFGRDIEDKKRKRWVREEGIRILSFIKNFLTNKEKELAINVLGNSVDNIDYDPKPLFSDVQPEYLSSISYESPINICKFKAKKIALNLKSEWTPQSLNNKYKSEDSLRPRGVEGLGDAIKEDVKRRTDEYLENIKDFFDRESIHPYYLYSILYGIEEMLRNKETLSTEQVNQLIDLFHVIKNSGEKIPFTRNDNRSWLSDWISVHKVVVDILFFILRSKDKEIIHKEHREIILNLVSYLFTIKDSPSEEDEKPDYGDPYHVAINSVRGRAFESFVLFVENDGKELKSGL